MTREEKSILEKAGIEVSDALGRFLGNEDIYVKFLLKFPNDFNYKQMKEYMEQGDCVEAFKCAHSIKGLAGNLSIIRLYETIFPIVELLRNNQLLEAKSHLPEIEEAYNEVTEAIRKLDI